MRVALLALLSALVLAAAGCGSEDVGAGESSAAEQLKAGALVYWETEADPDADQWEQAEELLRRFPDGDKWIAELRRSFESDTKVTWPEVREGLGGRLAVAVYASSMTDVDVVGLLNPDDPKKTLDVVEKLNASEEDPSNRLAVRRVGDWVAMSDKEASIDAALKPDGARALADEQPFEDGMAELPDDALSRVYVDVAAAVNALAGDDESKRALRMLGLDELDFAGAWAKARDDGAELAGVLKGEGADKLMGASEPYASKLLDVVPADAFAFVTFQGTGATRQLESLRSSPLYGMGINEIEKELGVRINDVLELFRGEVAFYAAPGTPIPELTLLLEENNPEEARQTGARLLRTLAQRAGGDVSEDGGVTTATFEGFTLSLAALEDAIALTTSRPALEELRGSGDKLADSERYEDALDAGDVPDEYTTLAWVDLQEAAKLFLGFATSSGEQVPDEVSRNLKPLGSLVAFGEQDGNVGRSRLFVEIQ